MSEGWTILGVILAVAIAVIGRGFVHSLKEGIRGDLIALGGIQRATDSMAQLSGTTTHAFAPPLAADRKYPYGWLWWRTQIGADGTAERDMGWALTYRRARRAAGLAVDWRSAGGEFVIAPDRTGLSLATRDDQVNRRSDQGH
ncbi:hypothetical protein [Streptomyces chattanoogensis]|uniref:Uncharacterized protein n=1 Tax=Streptomyces chattanoogensis TaxID=66876 RepID=A0A0N0GZF0_9ACTN|nr:hypothetical protein [Streptomyces chattanoogensis]KPC62682.1 hypothetical protein ADL29_18250 [Streptomyces chattanoogensis]